mgnify:CR=1 FL=1|tara:strand:- start:231 stop:380 length:150 start_codon:yes stop_codon:yes gene_type:complete
MTTPELNLSNKNNFQKNNQNNNNLISNEELLFENAVLYRRKNVFRKFKF